MGLQWARRRTPHAAGRGIRQPRGPGPSGGSIGLQRSKIGALTTTIARRSALAAACVGSRARRRLAVRQRPKDRLDQPFLADRLGDEIGHPGRPARRHVLGERIRGHRHDRRRRGRSVAPPDRPRRLQPVHLRHAHVHADQVVRRACRRLHRLDPVIRKIDRYRRSPSAAGSRRTGWSDCPPPAARAAAGQAPRAAPAAASAACCGSTGGAISRASGSVRRKRKSAALARHRLRPRSRRPCRSTICLLIASPRPDPPNRRVIELSACTKASNSVPSFSGAMPMPVSPTVHSIDGRHRAALDAAHADGDLAGVGELHRVGDQVVQHLADAPGVARAAPAAAPGRHASMIARPFAAACGL